MALSVARHAHAQEPPEPTPSGPAFVALPLFVIPVIEGAEVARQVSVGVTLELTEGQTAQSIEPKRAALIDAFYKELYGMFGARAHSDRIADERAIKQRLAVVSDRVLGAGVVKEVLIQKLFEQERPK